MNYNKQSIVRQAEKIIETYSKKKKPKRIYFYAILFSSFFLIIAYGIITKLFL